MADLITTFAEAQVEAYAEVKKLNDFTGKTSTEINNQIHEINLVRARTLGRLAAIAGTTHSELKSLTWKGIDSDFNPEESYISTTELKKIISRIEDSVKSINEHYSAIDGDGIVNLY